MLVDCIHLYVADAIDFIHTIVPAVFMYLTTSHTYNKVFAISDKRKKQN